MGTLDISARSFGQSLFSIDQTSTHLKAATELIERERQAALQKSDAYASKLHDTQTYVQRLEHAYSDVSSCPNLQS